MRKMLYWQDMAVNLIVSFCFYSVFGWAIDTAHRSFTARRYKPGGFSKYPFSPIYGFGALGVLALAPYLSDWPLWLEWLAYATTLGFYEYVGGVVTHRYFKRRLWNYSKDRWDIHGHTGPGYAAVWGLLALFTVYYMQPFLERLLEALAS